MKLMKPGLGIAIFAATLAAVVATEPAMGQDTESATGPDEVEAQDFTIVVPVDVSKIEDHVQAIDVACAVYADDPAAAGPRAQLIGEGTESVTTGDDFSGQVEVKFDAQEGEDPRDAKYWECRLEASTSERGDVATTVHEDVTFAYCSNEQEDDPQYVCAKEGTPLVTKISGSLQ